LNAARRAAAQQVGTARWAFARRFGAALFFAGLSVGAARAQGSVVRVGAVAELRRALAQAKPGDRVEVAPGDYPGFGVEGIRGAAGRPIALAAADPASRPVFRGGLHFSDVEHFELRGIEVRGAPANGVNIDDGGSFATPTRHVLLKDVVVADVGGRGNCDGIKLSGVEDFALENCVVERWGRGGSAVDMVGCRRGKIVDCVFRDRAEDAASSGVQCKGGTRDVAVRRARFEHAGSRAVNLGGSTGLQFFRPRPEGFEAKDLLVEDCVFVGSQAPVAFVGVDGATVRRNTFFRPTKWVARVLQETVAEGFAPCRNGVFEDNVVVYRAAEVRDAVNVGPSTAPETFRFARNFWFCEDAPARGAPKLPVAEKDARGGAAPGFLDAASGDFRLKAGGPAAAFGPTQFRPAARAR
jgi:hypothetical protein